jgi:precorrin-2 dehydrogenase/sirohydrochlorin ferrochelatase
MIPLGHDFVDERVLVFGGGAVGARKARRFAREASVVVCSPAFDADDYGGADLVRAAPTPAEAGDWLDRVDPALVVAATDDAALNAAVDEAARERGILRNRADQSGADGDTGSNTRDPGSVVVPATVRDGPVVVSVSTGGCSPALSRHLRQEIEPTVAGAGELASILGDLRPELKRQLDAQTRREALSAVANNDDVWKALDTESANPRQVATDVIADLTGDSI